MFSEVSKRVKKVGHPPGTAIYTGDKTGTPEITFTVYNAEGAVEKTGNKLETCMLQRKEGDITWINIEGLHDVSLIEKIAKEFKIHPLTVEDILNVDQRPKVEEFETYLFITLKVLSWQSKKSLLCVNQLSLVIGKEFVLSFEEMDTTRFDNIRKHLQNSMHQRLREQGSDYLAYRLIDTIIDEYFIVLEALGDQIEQVESIIINAPNRRNARAIYRLKQQILLLRKAIWPMREALGHLLYMDETLISKSTRLYLRDVYDHTMQAMDTLETFRDMSASLLDMYLSGLSIRMNEIMKTLTIITTIFIPITALSSIYGMNIPDVPLMQSHWAFIIIFSAMVMIVILMMLYFRKKKWI